MAMRQNLEMNDNEMQAKYEQIEAVKKRFIKSNRVTVQQFE